MKFTYKNNVVSFDSIPVGEFFMLPNKENIYLKIDSFYDEGYCVFNTTTKEQCNIRSTTEVIPLKTEVVIYQ